MSELNYPWGKSFPDDASYTGKWQDKSIIRQEDGTDLSVETVDTLGRNTISTVNTRIDDLIGVQAIPFTGYGYIHTSNNGAAYSAIAYESGNTNYIYWKIPCKVGDTYIINGHSVMEGSQAPTLACFYSFVDTDGKHKRRALRSSTVLENRVLTCTEDGLCIINLDTSYGVACSVVKTSTLSSHDADLETIKQDVQQALSKADGTPIPVAVEWDNGYFMTSSSTRGKSSASTNYRRTMENVAANDGDKLRVVSPSGYACTVMWFNSKPNYENQVDNTEAYAGYTLGSYGETIQITYNSQYYYVVYISLYAEGTTTAQPAAYPEIYRVLPNEHGGSVDDVGGFVRSANLFDYKTAIPNSLLSSSNGTISGDTGYWVTGKIPVDGAYVLSNNPYRICYYSEDGTFISSVINNNVYNVQTPPENASYMMACYSSSIVAYADANQISCYPAGYAGKFDMAYMDPFEVRALYASEVLTANKTYRVRNDGSGMNVIISANVKGKGTIRFRYAYPHRTPANNPLYQSMVYPIDCGNDEIHEWRVPPFPDSVQYLLVDLTVDSGDSLDLKWIKSRFDNAVRHDVIKRHGHFGVFSKAMTVQDCEDCARVGFDSFVVVPKLTKADENGERRFVCFHDDASIGNAFRDADGNPLSAEDQAKKISDFTYDELAALDIGMATSPGLAGRKISTVEEIFDVCAKTGMKPMFSVHGLAEFNAIATSDDAWGKIKTMLVERGLLDQMQIKAGSIGDLNRAHRIFGNDIDSYILDWNTTGDAVAVWKGVDWFDPMICKIEFFASTVSKAAVEAAVAEGIAVSSAQSTRSVARMKELISWGVTEFTEDNFYSFGLNY